MKLLLLLVLLSGCAHDDMDIKRAGKLCRKIYGPEQELPKPFPKDLAKSRDQIVEAIGACYREHVERTRDPRDYVSCGMALLSPKDKPRLTILSTQDFLLPEIVIQCTQEKFKRIRIPRVKAPIRLEFVFHHIAVTKG